MTGKDWKGSFAIPMTPFDEHDRIDAQVLADEIEFCIESRVGGIVVPVLVSEFGALSEEERRLMVRIPVEVSAGRVPVIANCAGVNTALAVEYATSFEKMGADALIAMPPYVLVPDFETTYAYFKAISDAVTIPVWIQNAGLAPLSTDQLVRLCSELEHVSWVKEEVSPSPAAIGRLVGRNSPDVEGVMGGVAGRYLVTERARGSKGVIHACQFCDVVQRIWELLDSGRDEEGEELFDRVLPGLVIEGLMGMAFAKEIMVRRGVFKNYRMRMQARPLDAFDFQEIDRIWKRIEPYLLWQKGAGMVDELER
jgi:4-hydroxy-tetrahydrodipicolinate synthase